MCYFCYIKDTHCGVVCAIIYLRVIRTREQPRNANAFLGVVAPFFLRPATLPRSSGGTLAAPRRVRNPARARRRRRASAEPAEWRSGERAEEPKALLCIYRLESGARPPMTGGQTREGWSDAMSSTRRSASPERVVCSSFFEIELKGGIRLKCQSCRQRPFLTSP